MKWVLGAESNCIGKNLVEHRSVVVMGVERRAGEIFVNQLVQQAVNKRSRLFECDKIDAFYWPFTRRIQETDNSGLENLFCVAGHLKPDVVKLKKINK